MELDVFSLNGLELNGLSLVPRPSLSLSSAITILEAGKKELVKREEGARPGKTCHVSVTCFLGQVGGYRDRPHTHTFPAQGIQYRHRGLTSLSCSREQQSRVL